MRTILVFVLACACLGADPRPGNYQIRFEPTAKLQTGAPIPFAIHVWDSLRKPLVDATVTVHAQRADGTHEIDLKALRVEDGVYMAKPQFSVAGQWNIRVTVERNDMASTRTIEYAVSD